MAKPREIEVHWPMGGVNRSKTYAQKEAPYTTPGAVNVRGYETLERRGRGGSRPGLIDFLDVDFGTTITGIQKVGYVDNSGNLQVKLVVIADGNMNIVDSSARTTTTSYLTDESGNHITVGGDNIIFTSTVAAVSPLGSTDAFQMAEHDGKVYIADSTLRFYEPRSGIVQPISSAPTNQPLVTFYRERLFLSGANHIVYYSRQGDFADWSFGDNKDDIGRAGVDYAGDNSIVGGTVTCQLAWGREAFIFGHADGLYVIYGNPLGRGSKKTVSASVGPIAPRAATIADGLLVFLGRDGLYTWPIGSNEVPRKMSEVVPDEMRDTSATANDIILEYDKKNLGVHVFITPATGSGSHWWVDMKYRAIWPVKFGSATHQPIACGVLPLTGDSDVVLGCKDGYLRRFSNAKTTDDGTAISSGIGFGPFHIGRSVGSAGQLTNLITEIASGSGAVTWATVVGDTAEGAVDSFKTDLDAGTTANVTHTGSWDAGYNIPTYPRTRGAWLVLWLSSTAQWSYESVLMEIKKLGRLR